MPKYYLTDLSYSRSDPLVHGPEYTISLSGVKTEIRILNRAIARFFRVLLVEGPRLPLFLLYNYHGYYPSKSGDSDNSIPPKKKLKKITFKDQDLGALFRKNKVGTRITKPSLPREAA